MHAIWMHCWILEKKKILLLLKMLRMHSGHYIKTEKLEASVMLPVLVSIPLKILPVVRVGQLFLVMMKLRKKFAESAYWASIKIHGTGIEMREAGFTK